MNTFKYLMLYFFQDYKRSYKYIAPLLVYIVLISAMYSNKPAYVMSSYAVTCICIYAISAWLSFGFIDNEYVVQQQLTILHIKNENIYYLCKVLFMWSFILILDIFTVYYPILNGAFIRKVVISDIIIALISHAIVGFLGITVGSLFSSRLVKDRKMAILFLNLLIIVSTMEKPIVQSFPFLKWIGVILPPAYLMIDKIGSIDYINIGNIFNIIFTFAIGLIYLLILIILFIKCMKKKLF
ncbi:hypothetical protein [Clostridium sp. JS66]|uniref:hypothetical protein n=1 Tax=Clostridium sp. JS66 TaxID=3064705 RepID=UPI00298E9EA8|nr:hypothetical protein [Clostridium sp. JS66]WPC43965.1 hypothetical protein Q6H37_10950 [Clostridium sp. JS66]